MAQHTTTIPDELKVRYTDVLSLGESNRPMELYDGEFIMTAMATPQHQRIVFKLGLVLDLYITAKRLGTVYPSVDVYLSEVTLLQPDICFLSNERSTINDGKKFNGVPDVVVEVLSESTEHRDRTFKFREYARGGAKEYWLVSPEKKEIEVYKNSERGFQLVNIYCATDVLNSPLFSDIQLEVKQVFE